MWKVTLKAVVCSAVVVVCALTTASHVYAAHPDVKRARGGDFPFTDGFEHCTLDDAIGQYHCKNAAGTVCDRGSGDESDCTADGVPWPCCTGSATGSTCCTSGTDDECVRRGGGSNNSWDAPLYSDAQTSYDDAFPPVKLLSNANTEVSTGVKMVYSGVCSDDATTLCTDDGDCGSGNTCTTCAATESCLEDDIIAQHRGYPGDNCAVRFMSKGIDKESFLARAVGRVCQSGDDQGKSCTQDSDVTTSADCALTDGVSTECLPTSSVSVHATVNVTTLPVFTKAGAGMIPRTTQAIIGNTSYGECSVGSPAVGEPCTIATRVDDCGAAYGCTKVADTCYVEVEVRKCDAYSSQKCVSPTDDTTGLNDFTYFARVTYGESIDRCGSGARNPFTPCTASFEDATSGDCNASSRCTNDISVVCAFDSDCVFECAETFVDEARCAKFPLGTQTLHSEQWYSISLDEAHGKCNDESSPASTDCATRQATCSTTTSTDCSVDTDCPGGETCVSSYCTCTNDRSVECKENSACPDGLVRCGAFIDGNDIGHRTIKAGSCTGTGWTGDLWACGDNSDCQSSAMCTNSKCLNDSSQSGTACTTGETTATGNRCTLDNDVACGSDGECRLLGKGVCADSECEWDGRCVDDGNWVKPAAWPEYALNETVNRCRTSEVNADCSTGTCEAQACGTSGVRDIAETFIGTKFRRYRPLVSGYNYTNSDSVLVYHDDWAGVDIFDLPDTSIRRIRVQDLQPVPYKVPRCVTASENPTVNICSGGTKDGDLCNLHCTGTSVSCEVQTEEADCGAGNFCTGNCTLEGAAQTWENSTGGCDSTESWDCIDSLRTSIDVTSGGISYLEGRADEGGTPPALVDIAFEHGVCKTSSGVVIPRLSCSKATQTADCGVGNTCSDVVDLLTGECKKDDSGVCSTDLNISCTTATAITDCRDRSATCDYTACGDDEQCHCNKGRCALTKGTQCTNIQADSNLRSSGYADCPTGVCLNDVRQTCTHATSLLNCGSWGLCYEPCEFSVCLDDADCKETLDANMPLSFVGVFAEIGETCSGGNGDSHAYDIDRGIMPLLYDASKGYYPTTAGGNVCDVSGDNCVEGDVDVAISDNTCSDQEPDGEVTFTVPFGAGTPTWDIGTVNQGLGVGAYYTDMPTAGSGVNNRTRAYGMLLTLPIQIPPEPCRDVIPDINGDGRDTVCIVGDSTYADSVLETFLLKKICEPDDLIMNAAGSMTLGDAREYWAGILDGSADASRVKGGLHARALRGASCTTGDATCNGCDIVMIGMGLNSLHGRVGQAGRGYCHNPNEEDSGDRCQCPHSSASVMSVNQGGFCLRAASYINPYGFGSACTTEADCTSDTGSDGLASKFCFPQRGGLCPATDVSADRFCSQCTAGRSDVTEFGSYPCTEDGTDPHCDTIRPPGTPSNDGECGDTGWTCTNNSSNDGSGYNRCAGDHTTQCDRDSDCFAEDPPVAGPCYSPDCDVFADLCGQGCNDSPGCGGICFQDGRQSIAGYESHWVDMIDEVKSRNADGDAGNDVYLVMIGQSSGGAPGVCLSDNGVICASNDDCDTGDTCLNPQRNTGVCSTAQTCGGSGISCSEDSDCTGDAGCWWRSSHALNEAAGRTISIAKRQESLTDSIGWIDHNRYTKVACPDGNRAACTRDGIHFDDVNGVTAFSDVVEKCLQNIDGVTSPDGYYHCDFP